MSERDAEEDQLLLGTPRKIQRSGDCRDFCLNNSLSLLPRPAGMITSHSAIAVICLT